MNKKCNRKKYFAECYAILQKGDIILQQIRQILMYIQIFYHLEAAFLLKGIQQSTVRMSYKPKKKKQNIVCQNKYLKEGRYFEESNEKSGNHCK